MSAITVTTAASSIATETTESTQASALSSTPEKPNRELSEKVGASNAESNVDITSPDTPSPDGKGKKRNRCYMCRKKVGLTGKL